RPRRAVPLHLRRAAAAGGCLQRLRGAAARGPGRAGADAGLGARGADRRTGRGAGLARYVPLSRQPGLHLLARLRRGGDWRARQPGRRGGRGPHPGRGAQLRGRLPRLQPRIAVRARRADRRPDDPPLRPLLRTQRPGGVTMTLARHVAAALVVAVAVWALSVSLSSFRAYQIADIAVYVVAIAGLTVLIGLSGQISLGNGAFMAV